MQNKSKKLSDEAQLKKAAYLKYIDKTFANYLSSNNPDSPLIKQYANSYFCQHDKFRNEANELDSTHCKTRWCRTCNRIKTAKLMNQYLPSLEKHKNLYFLTLTAKTVPEKELKQRISDMEKFWTNIKNNSTRNNNPLHGIKKFEINPTHDNKYHPHFHILLTSENQAKHIQSEWLRLFKKKYPNNRLVSLRANKYFKIPHDKLIEIFKYSSKLVTKDNKDQTDQLGRKVIADAKKYDIIFQALKGKRTIQSFGNIKPVQISDYTDLTKPKIPRHIKGNIFTHSTFDWISEYGEPLTNYEPNEKTTAFINQMKNNFND